MSVGLEVLVRTLFLSWENKKFIWCYFGLTTAFPVQLGSAVVLLFSWGGGRRRGKKWVKNDWRLGGNITYVGYWATDRRVKLNETF